MANLFDVVFGSGGKPFRRDAQLRVTVDADGKPIIETVEGEEEERRLFYVSVTRARNELYLSFPILRFTPGGDSMHLESRFLKEIPKDLVEEWNLRPFNAYG